METKKIYAKRIFNAKSNSWNKTTNEIYIFCTKKKVDPYFFLALYYIEDYFRPKWLQFFESLLFKLNILQNPSVGPFQVRISNLDTIKIKNGTVITKSLSYALSLFYKCGLDKKNNIANFISFGKLYNLDDQYGSVHYNLYWLIKKNEWVKIRS